MLRARSLRQDTRLYSLSGVLHGAQLNFFFCFPDLSQSNGVICASIRRRVEDDSMAGVVKGEIRGIVEEHPFLTIGVLITTLFCALPVVTFLAFVLFSSCCMALVFVVVEGAVIAIATSVLVVVLSLAVMAAGSLTLLLVGVWLVWDVAVKLAQPKSSAVSQ